MTNKNVKLYNIIFPIWLIWLIPITWIIVLPANFIFDLLVNAVSLNPFKSIYAVLWVTICVVITAMIIYLFNYKVALKKSSLEEDQKKKLALSLAIFTAPYTFYIPTAWFF